MNVLSRLNLSPLSKVSDRRGAALYKVRDAGGRLLAAKLVTVAPENIEARKLLENEARVLRVIDGRFAPRLEFYLEEKNEAVLVASWLEGTRSYDYFEGLKGERDPLRSRNELVRGYEVMTESLASLHALGFVHGDLQPAHFLFESPGKAFMLDFGMSKRPRTSEVTREGGMVHFTAPEVAIALLDGSREPRLDFVSEVYSLSAVLWYLYAGSVPVKYCDDATYEEMLKSVATGALALNFGDGPRRNKKLEEVLKAGLSLDPCRRPQSAPDLKGLLAECGEVM